MAIILNNEGTCLLMSLTLESSLSFQTYLLSNYSKLNRLEVFLHGIQRQSNHSPSILSDPFSSCPVISCLKLIENIEEYIEKLKQVIINK